MHDSITHEGVIQFMFDTEKQELIGENPLAVIAALETDDRSRFEHRIEEMINLTEACDMEVFSVITQKLPHPDPGNSI